MRAQDYIANRFDAGVIALVETHVKAGMVEGELGRCDQWGYKASGRAAISTSQLGSSGGAFAAVRKGLATYILGPFDKLSGLVTEPTARYCSGRSVRLAVRDLLVIGLYLPPGAEHMEHRHDALQDVGHLLKHTRGQWVVAGDFNQVPEEFIATGFPGFAGGAVVAGTKDTCRQGQGSNIDYVLADAAIAGLIKVEIDPDSPWGPHFGIKIDSN